MPLGTGVHAYCGGLWVAACFATADMAKVRVLWAFRLCSSQVELTFVSTSGKRDSQEPNEIVLEGAALLVPRRLHTTVTTSIRADPIGGHALYTCTYNYCASVI